MEKNVVISMTDGTQWAVKVSDIAKHRDDHGYSNSEHFFSEYRDEAIDYLQNHTNWGDIKAEKIKDPYDADYSEFFNCDMEIKEI